MSGCAVLYEPRTNLYGPNRTHGVQMRRRNRMNPEHVQEVRSILRGIEDADEESMRMVLDGLRSPVQGYSVSTQTEIDGVVARWKAKHS